MSSTFKQDVKDLIASAKQVYQLNPNRIFSDYRHETDLIKEYDGRQILELLQNADDAGSSKVLITIDINSRTLRISNTGEPFSIGGVQSLMLANSSPKTKKIYIGNKGLGFRSILNWSEQVDILSNGCCLSFSVANAKKQFASLDIAAEKLHALMEARNYSDTAVPFAVLAIPDLDDDTSGSSEWATTIHIRYDKDYETDIIDQLSGFREECLLFLNHLTELTISGLENGPRSFRKQAIETDSGYQIIINNRQWSVVTDEQELPRNLQDDDFKGIAHYGLKIAYNSELSDELYQLFTFFPANVPIRLPCVIHGTFELDNARKYLVDTDKNKYILERLVELLTNTAATLKLTEVGWHPYRLLTPIGGTDHALIRQFYALLQQAKEKATIYPTLGKNYRALSVIRFYGNIFSTLVMEAKFPGFEELLLPVPGDIDLKPLFIVRPYHNSQIKSLIEQLSCTVTDVELHARLIYSVYYDLRGSHAGVQYAILTNDEHQVIPLANVAFTPILREKGAFAKPDFVKIDLMNARLYEHLSHQMGSPNRPMLPREVQARIKDITNIQPYDPVEVTERIITGTLDHIRYQSTEAKTAAIKTMVRDLWVNYNNSSRTTILNREVPLLTRSGYQADSRNLFLGSSYPSGTLTEEIFRDSYSASDYLLDLDQWGLDTVISEPVNAQALEDFFLWLGVNKLTRLESYYKEDNIWNGYFSYVKTQTPAPAVKNSNYFKISGNAIKGFSRISRNVGREELLLWILKCDKLRSALEKINSDKTEYQDYYKKWHVISEKPSFIQYQLKSIHHFDQYVIEDYNIPVINTTRVDYKHPLFLKYGVSKPDVDSILLKLGAKESFNQLDEKRVFDIINSLRTQDRSGQYTQKLYRIALEWFDKHNVHSKPYLYLFAKKNGVGSYEYSPVYYSDNQALPKRIMDEFAILNLPKRAGEEKAMNLFGIKLFKDINLEIDQSSLIPHPLEIDFLQRWEEMKPLILAHRLDKLNTDNVKKDAVVQLKNCDIRLVAGCSYRFGERSITMEKNELINSGNQYFLMASPDYKEIGLLRKDSGFCDAFAEILCIQFKVNELKNVFRNLLINEIADSRHVIEDDLNEGLMEEVKEWLGLSTPLLKFWKTIFQVKNREVPENVSDDQALLALVNAAFGTAFCMIDQITMDGYTTANVAFLKNVLETLAIRPEDYFGAIKDKNGLIYYHLKNAEHVLYDLEDAFKCAFWLKLQAGSQLEKRTFLTGLHEFRNRMKSALLSQLQDFRYCFEPDLNAIVVDTIQANYQLRMQPVTERFSPANLYQDMLSDFGKSADDLPVPLRSLLYFEGCAGELREALETMQPDSHEPDSQSDSEVAIEVAEMTGADMTSLKPPVYPQGQGGKKPWVAHPRKLQAQQDAGLASEKLVKGYLEAEYGKLNVKWRSGYSDAPDRDDNLHYDMQYKNHADVWKYVEVKTLGPFGFTISQPEVDKGKNEPDDYELFLVRGNRIFIVKDFFKFKEGESFEQNSRYHVSPKDYHVSFQLSPQLLAQATLVLADDDVD